MEDENKFPLEKILTISARDYCENTGKNISQYDLVGVHYEDSGDCRDGDIAKYFIQKIPNCTEVIVGYMAYSGGRGGEEGFYSPSSLLFGAHGTALIPRE